MTRIALILFLFLFLVTQKGFSQERNRLSYSLTFSLNNSNSISSRSNALPTNAKLGFLGIATIHYLLSSKVDFVSGLGYMNYGEVQNHTFEVGMIRASKRSFTSDQIIIPVGLSFHFQKIRVQPSIGLTYNFNNKVKLSTLMDDGMIVNMSTTFKTNSFMNAITLPAMLAIDRKFNFFGKNLRAGINGYYTLLPLFNDQGHDFRQWFYGFGLHLGVDL